MTAVQIDIQRKAFAGRQGETVAIRNFNLVLQEGEFVCLVGPSGCGKTTLLNIVAGLDRQFDGTVQSTRGGHARRIGYVFQNPRLLPWRTVRQNIELALPPDSDRGLVTHLLQVMGLEKAQDQYPQRLSLGMSRRVALVRAFAIQPDLLLMDEPFVSLDAPTARRVRTLLLDVLAERPHTVLFVTHDLREAIALADRLIFLTSHPMTRVADIPVITPRSQRARDGWENEFQRHLVNDHPTIRNLL